MLFAKKSPAAAPSETAIAVSTIPLDFYGGANPVVKFKTVEKEVDLGKKSMVLSPTDKKLLDKSTASGSGQALHPTTLFSNRKFLLIGGGVLFIAVVAGASWYYWRQAVNEQKSRAIVPAVETQPVSESTVPTTTPEETITPTSTPEEVIIPPPLSLLDAPLSFPSTLLGDTPDLDRDGLSDAEDLLFKTDPGTPDSDRDGYSDSHEIYNLFNPIGEEPMRLADSGLVKEFVNPTFNYKLYYPASWAVGNVDENYRDMLFSTITGENIEVRVFDKEPNQSFNDWFGIWAPAEQLADLIEFTTAFKEKGWRRNDYLVYYFVDEARVYVMLYHTTDSPAINYRTAIKMFGRSFRLPGNSAVITNPVVESNAGNPVSGATSATSTTSSPTPSL